MTANDGAVAQPASSVDDTSEPTGARALLPGAETRLERAVRRRGRIGSILDFVRRSPVGGISAVFLVAAFAVALFGPWLGTGDPEAITAAARFQDPSSTFPMGTDYLGRSVLARLVSGLRISLALATTAALLAATFGTILGLTAGYFGGVVDDIVMRITDVFFAFPTLLLALLVAMIVQPGTTGVLITIVIATVPIFSRVARGPTLSVRTAEYTVAANVIGAPPGRVLFRHVLPNVATPLLVQLAFTLSGALIAEGALSFLGLGVQPPTPSLGSMLSDGKTYMELAPWTMLFPAVTLAALILAVNLLGDELQSFTDPRLRRR